MKKLLFLLFMIIFTPSLFAEIGCNWTGNINSSWFISSNWHTNDVPDNDKAGATDVYKPYFGPSANFKCVLDNGEPTVMHLHCDSRDPKPFTLDEGGHLTVEDWCIVGAGADNSKMVIDGGVLDCMSHLFVGTNSANVNGNGSVVEQNGGEVSVYGAFGPGFYGGKGRYQLSGGVLRAIGYWDLTNDGGQGSIDITNGVFVCSGDDSGQVVAEVNAGRLTAFGGTGKIRFDYNVTNPGSTTVYAIPDTEGDIDDDDDVDMMDMYLFAGQWLDSTCDNVADFDGDCMVNFYDFEKMAHNWLTGVVTYWHVAETTLAETDVIITPYWIEDFGVVADGQTDVTDGLQQALISISNMGGGSIFLPAGGYIVRGHLTIPAGVTLYGDWQRPVAGEPIVGTIIEVYEGRGDENATPFMMMGDNAGVKNIAFWYPEQMPDDIVAYPPTLHGAGDPTVENVTFVNAYFGFTTYREGYTARPTVRAIYGTPLKTGVEFDCLADVGRIETLDFSPAYWAGSGLPNAPLASEHEPWIYDNGIAFIFRRVDWSYAAYVTAEGYGTGLALLPSRYDGNHPNGQVYELNFTNCKEGIFVDDNSGFLVSRMNVQNCEVGVHYGPDADNKMMFHTCTFNTTDQAILNEGDEWVLMQNNVIENGLVQADGGYLVVMSSTFKNAGATHIQLGSGVRGASIQGNFFYGGAHIVDGTNYPVEINHAPLTSSTMPEYDYKKPAKVYTAAKNDLFVVTETPYLAAADGVTDDTAAFQQAIADAQANGGGIVFVPGGDYRLDGRLVVPGGVELRGIFDIAHSPSVRGSVLNVCADRGKKNGTPFIQIQPHGGVRGLTFHYPEQIYDETDTDMWGMVPYPYTIRGLGEDVYIINIAATIPYDLIDLGTVRCDRHFVDGVLATALLTGIYVGNGSMDGQIHNGQLNPSMYTHQANHYDSIPHGAADGIHTILWRDSRPYVFGNMTGEVLHQNFVFGGVYGIHTIEENGVGPSGYCLGFGVDQCTNSVQIDAIGEGGLDMINAQLVTVNREIGRYVETGEVFDDTFRIFNGRCWGSNDTSVEVNNGTLELNLFMIDNGGHTAYSVKNNGMMKVYGGTESQRPGEMYTVESSADAQFTGCVFNTYSSQMPVNSTNVVSRGNLKTQ